MKNLSDEQLIENFEALVKSERKITADVIEHLREIYSRKLYLQRGHKSIYSYLNKGLKYSPAAAYRRIEAARLMEISPDLDESLENGDINLTQISILTRGFRRHGDVSAKEKVEIINKVKGQEADVTEKIVAQELDLPLIEEEKARFQKNESVRLEITFSKVEMEILTHLKEVISHRKPNPSWAELFILAAEEVIKAKDPLTHRSFRSEAAGGQSAAQKKHIIFTRDKSCRWIDPASGQTCGSRFQLQIDHIHPRWAGGGDELENLQLLCSTHNRLKYERGN